MPRVHRKHQTHRRSLQFSATAGCTPMVNHWCPPTPRLSSDFQVNSLQHWPLPHNKQPIHVLPNQDSPQNPGWTNILPQTLSSRRLSSPQLQFLPQILPRGDLQKAFSWTKDSHSCEEEPPGISGSWAEWTSTANNNSLNLWQLRYYVIIREKRKRRRIKWLLRIVRALLPSSCTYWIQLVCVKLN